MSSGGPRTIGLVVEADGDARTVTTLVDRVLGDCADWATPELLDSLRQYRGAEPQTAVTYWKKVKALCREHGVKVHGKFEGQSGAPDARAARRVLALFKRLGLPDTIVLVRDADNQPERLDGLRQARDASSARETIAIGVAIPEREAWILAAIDTSVPEYKQTARQLRKTLGFDPTQQPHRLGGSGKREAKAVLRQFIGSGPEQELAVLGAVPIKVQEQRARQCGLGPFLDELREHVAPRIL